MINHLSILNSFIGRVNLEPEYLVKFLIIILLLGFLSFLLTSYIRRFALRRKIVSVPNERSLHGQPTPVGGGLAIVTCWYIGISILYFAEIIDSRLYFALLSGILLTIVSLIDDLLFLLVGCNHLLKCIRH